MPGQYSTRCGRRPCLGEAEPEAAPGRLFLCARCQAMVLICSCCDRGQIYCAGGCAQDARHQAQRAASQRYQASRRGRMNHAARTSRWRARQKNVTHQGSPPRPSDDGVSVDTAVAASKSSAASASDVAMGSQDHGPPFWCCHWCGRRCLPFVRTGNAIRPRWALRDIKGTRLKLTPVDPNDMRTLIDMGYVEEINDEPVVTAAGLQQIEIGD